MKNKFGICICIPVVNSAVVQSFVTDPAIYPPITPMNILMAISSGLKIIQANIFGRTKKFAELIPIISRASICSVTLIVPILDAI